MIAFDMEVDVSRRRLQPKFYGMIPDDNNKRGRSFMLMTLISALHNISRSVGYALMMSTDPLLLAQFVIGEFGLYIFWKVSRNDLMMFVRIEGALASAENIDRWGVEQKEWFRIEQIPDEFLPATKFLEAGGFNRKRKTSVSMREFLS
ncbi:hypothetical protein ScalyP_jg12128 [Parmales sp. scaly parma]|nr:hypothetical protein ScalyP_jg12128 [Parmales sp. scaly parma]